MRSLLLAGLVATAHATLSLTLQGSAYRIMNDGVQWFASGNYSVRNNAVTMTSGQGSLTMASSVPYNGADTLGSYTGYALTWNGAGGNNGILVTRIKQYAVWNAIVFEQYFPNGLNNAEQGGNNPENDLIAAFPSFAGSSRTFNSPLAYLTWQNTMCGGDAGMWKGGINTGSFGMIGGPVVLFNSTGGAVVISALNNFFVGETTWAASIGDQFAGGVGGRVNTVPAGFTHATIMIGQQAGQSIEGTMRAWGDALLTLGGKKATTPTSDAVVSKLSYWTDNGAYYYYLTEPGKTYEQTMLDVNTYLGPTGLNLPINYFQFDSWWYFKQEPGNGAVLLWEPMPSVFPDGMNNWFNNMPLVLHNRYFADINNYTADYTFLRDPGAACSLPIDENMFLYIMGKAQKWGMIQYEQDWLVTVTEDLPQIVQSNVTAGRDWLFAMSNAAQKLGITIQYCMALPMHILQSTALQPVTNARASGDYHPGQDNWNIGLSSLLMWGAGLMPSKDDYWTTQNQPNSPYPGANEPNWQLQAIVVALSVGPNGPSDMVGGTNKSLVMSTCNGAGSTLHPDRPAFQMDAGILQVFNIGSVPDVTHSYTMLTTASGEKYATHFVLAVRLGQAYTINYKDLSPMGSVMGRYAVFDYFAPGAPVGYITPTGPFTIATGQGQPSAPQGSHNIRYYVVAPLMANGWYFYGEAGKIVPVASQRVSNLRTTANSFSVSVAGAPLESAGLVLSATNGQGTYFATCPSSQGSTATFSCSGNACTCA